MREEIQQQITLPLKKAVEISIKSLKMRFGRSFITTGGIVLTIAFLMSVFTSQAIDRALLQNGPEEIKILLQGTHAQAGPRQVWLVSLSLLVCVVGITNAMLMSVTERYKEIGTMKCLGALNKFVIELFLLESLFQGLAGSIAGALVGIIVVAITRLISYGGLVFDYFPWFSILKCALFSVGAGVFLSVVGALYPAQQAAKMVPADAMRQDA